MDELRYLPVSHIIHIAPTPPPRKGAASFALKPVTAREVTNLFGW